MRILTLLLLLLGAGSAAGEEITLNAPAPDGLRPGGSIADTLPTPPIAGEPRAAGREVRNYPEQPPVIPHSIRGYQVDVRFNRCLDCHSRSAAAAAGAPMVSVTHFMDRDFQVRGAVTPNRYFCTQCHVPQTDAKPLVDNTFIDMDRVLQQETERQLQQGGRR